MHINKIPVFYCSFPKTGRTWVRFILANYYNEKYSLNLQIDLNNMFHLLPNYESDPLKGLPAYQYADHKSLPLLIFDHSPFHQGYTNQKVIFQVRSIYDTMVSHYFQARYRLGQYPYDIKHFIREKDFGIPRLAGYINSWSAGLGSTQHIIVGYEQMHEDSVTTIKNILCFIQSDIDESIMESAISASNFQRMKNIEISRGFPNRDPARNTGVDNNALRAREGKVGGYKKYLDENDINYIKKTCDQLLSDASRNVLSKTGTMY